MLSAINDALQPNGALFNSILGGNTQSGAQMLSSVASVFMKSAEEAGNDTETLNNVVEVRIWNPIDMASN